MMYKLFLVFFSSFLWRIAFKMMLLAPLDGLHVIFIIVSCFRLSLASWLLFSNKVQFSSTARMKCYRKKITKLTCN